MSSVWLRIRLVGRWYPGQSGLDCVSKVESIGQWYGQQFGERRNEHLGLKVFRSGFGNGRGSKGLIGFGSRGLVNFGKGSMELGVFLPRIGFGNFLVPMKWLVERCY